VPSWASTGRIGDDDDDAAGMDLRDQAASGTFMINASSMPALLPSFLGMSHTITACHNNRHTT
jgi:hypothetical protein